MARIVDIVIDCRHPASLARFWAGALDTHGRLVVMHDPEGNEFCLIPESSLS